MVNAMFSECNIFPFVLKLIFFLELFGPV